MARRPLRIAFFHNFTPLGETLARSLLAMSDVELLFVGSVDPIATNDSEFARLVHDRSIRCASSAMLASTETIASLSTFAPHLIVVATFRYKLPSELLSIPTIAAINLHTSLLPRYRGACPEYWCIRNGDTESGVTIHHITPRFDAGDILAQASFPLTDTDNALSFVYKATSVARPLLDALVRRYANGEQPVAITQDETHVTNALVPRDSDLRINWFATAREIERCVRAAYPAYEAHTYCGDERVLIRSARVVEERHLPPGQLHLDSEGKRLLIGTGENSLEVLSVIANENRSLRGEDFFRSRFLDETAKFR